MSQSASGASGLNNTSKLYTVVPGCRYDYVEQKTTPLGTCRVGDSTALVLHRLQLSQVLEINTHKSTIKISLLEDWYWNDPLAPEEKQTLGWGHSYTVLCYSML